MDKSRIKIESSDRGCTIYVDDKWVLDASLFTDDLRFEIDTERMKQRPFLNPSAEHSYISFKFDESEKARAIRFRIEVLKKELDCLRFDLEKELGR